MIIQIASDLHLEFGSNAKIVRNTAADVLVLAGDITVGAGYIEAALEQFAARFPQVVYVLGNHELYGASYKGVRARLAGLPKNVHLLDNEIVTLYGYRFLGSTMWFPQPKRADENDLSDFSSIYDFNPWVYEQNAASVKWLCENVILGDVVVTHHLPSHRSVHARYVGSALNEFFVCDVERVIELRRPSLWIHGHTHQSCDYRLNETRVVCNPYGYKGQETNPKFDSRKCVIV